MFKRTGRKGSRAARQGDHWTRITFGPYRYQKVRLCSDAAVSERWERELQAAVDRKLAGEDAGIDKLKTAGVPDRLMAQLDLISTRRKSRAKSWADHVADYVGELRTAGKSAAYIRIAKLYLDEIGTACGWGKLWSVEREVFAGFIEKRRATAGVRTLKNIRDTLRGFIRWAVEYDRLDGAALKVFAVDVGDPKTDRKRVRRALTDADVVKLLDAVKDTPRELVYRFALASGLRHREIRLLEWRDVRTDGDDVKRPILALRPEATKSKRADVVPLNADIAKRLADLRRLRPFAQPTDRVFPSVPTLDRWKADLKAADIDYEDGEGRICGFHSLRVTLGTLLERAGETVTTRMEIMRHTDPRVSYGSYADRSLLDTAGAVEWLPVFSTGAVVAVREASNDAPVTVDSARGQNRVQTAADSSHFQSAGVVDGGRADRANRPVKSRVSRDFPKEYAGVEETPRVGLEPTT